MRGGKFTSSSIYKLMSNGKGTHGFGAPAITYIEEKRMELRLGRDLGSEVSSRPLSWGKLVEQRVFDLLGLEYVYQSDVRFKHTEYGQFWTGAPDLIKGNMFAEVKCPYTLKSFCEMVDSLTSVEAWKACKPEYYWQNVSNAILTGSNEAEIIIYAPYQSELEAIRELANNYEGDQNKVAWINWAADDELPWIPENAYYKNLNIFKYEIPQQDKDALTERVKLAIEMLNI